MNKILKFFSNHPLLGFIGFLGSIASIIGLIYAAFPSKRDLTFCVNPVRTPIIQSAKSSDVSVTYRGIPIEGNLTAAQIAIWNAGREPIREDDIRSPITLRTLDGCRIFEVSISKTNSVTKFRVEQSSTNMEAGRVEMSWKMLERDEGALIQIIYAGTILTPIQLEGTVIGQHSPRELRSSWRPDIIRLGKLVAVFFVLIGLTTVVMVTYLHLKRPGTKVLGVFAAGLLLIANGMSLFWMLGGAGTLTPFGF